jgi:putative endonuclease
MLLLNRRKLLSDRARLGRWSEKRCERFLKAKGLRTLIRNYRCKVGELDLVMVDADGSIVFVEVRSRAEEGLVAPEATITPAKRAHVSQAARWFLAAHRIEDRPLRFDVVTLVLSRSGPPHIQHYPNAFVP